jgi:glutathione S-transferase
MYPILTSCSALTGRTPSICRTGRHGEQISVADLTVGAYLIYSEQADISLTAYPHLLAWWSRLRQRPAWSASEADVPQLG